MVKDYRFYFRAHIEKKAFAVRGTIGDYNLKQCIARLSLKGLWFSEVCEVAQFDGDKNM